MTFATLIMISLVDIITYFNNHILENINYLKNEFNDIGKYFKIISFDNLAIEQLAVQNKTIFFFLRFFLLKVV